MREVWLSDYVLQTLNRIDFTLIVDVLELVDLIRLIYNLVTSLEVYEAVSWLACVCGMSLLPCLFHNWLALFREGTLEVHQEVIHHRVDLLRWLERGEGTINVVTFLFTTFE